MAADRAETGAPSPDDTSKAGRQATGLFGLDLLAPELPIRPAACLHYVNAPIEPAELEFAGHRFSAGQTLKVTARFYDAASRAWLVTCRSLEAQDRAEAFPPGTLLSGRVARLLPGCCLVEAGPGFTCRLCERDAADLKADGRLKPGEPLRLRVVQWDFRHGSAMVELAQRVGVPGKVEVLECQLKRRGRALWRLLHVNVKGVGRVVCDVTHLVSPEERLRPGETVRVAVGGERVPGEFAGDLVVPEREVARYGAPPAVGAVVAARVLSVERYGAFCLLADRTIGLLHRNDMAVDASADLLAVLRPRDMVRVKIISRPGRGKYELRSAELETAAA